MRTLSIIGFILCMLQTSPFSFAQRFDYLSNSSRLAMLDLPSGVVDMVLDTDTYNEIDDQFTLVYALLSPERINLRGVYAAPFIKKLRASSPEEGMQKSYEEILRILDFMEIPPDDLAFKGSAGFLESEENPIESEAARHLIALSKEYSAENPLVVVAVGAITNIASAILIDPAITSRLVLVWVGGHGYNWTKARSFNFKDLHATQVVFDSPKIDEPGYSKVLWDIAGIAWVINPDWIPTEIRSSPIITSDYTYSFNPDRHLIKAAYFANRDPVFNDLFKKINTSNREE